MSLRVQIEYCVVNNFLDRLKLYAIFLLYSKTRYIDMRAVHYVVTTVFIDSAYSPLRSTVSTVDISNYSRYR